MFFVVYCSFPNIDLEIEKTHPRVHNAEKESMTTVRSKVTSEHGNLANGGIFNSKTLQNFIYIYIKLALICQTTYKAQVNTLASILMELIERQEKLNQLKL